MISAGRLFLVPSLGAFLLLIPFLGIPIYLLILCGWYYKNQDDIHSYFKGQNYHQNEYKDLEGMR